MPMPDLRKTIELAAAKVGSQRALAKLLGDQDSTISAFKKGRPCSYQKHAQIAAVAGLKDRAVRILMAGMAESLSDDIEHEAAAKVGLVAMLNALPPSTDDVDAARTGRVGNGS
ncbi:hypothetical protein [Xylophilus sp.]|uniref:hypothetical protein n=1 Tax=Xylophilus sp. TaxID=2653893 RepID=UPI0013BA53D8|nr:hypothetical protein [Xylophilus sp.]KAF1043563.1 MAG: hypothetical protein GAK38_03899 [Xylophilus sp.]